MLINVPRQNLRNNIFSTFYFSRPPLDSYSRTTVYGNQEGYGNNGKWYISIKVIVESAYALCLSVACAVHAFKVF